MALTEKTREEMREIIARYPRPRSAIMPLLHLVQAEEGYVTGEGIEICAAELGLSTAEVAAVTTFYTMYKRRPIGDYHVGVCTNTLCAVMGGDAILESLKEHLGVGNDETTPDGRVTLEHVECNAACDYAPVVMVNWEFFDNQTPSSARELVDSLRSGELPTPTRGAPLCTWREASRVLAGFPDGRAAEGPTAGPPSLLGLELARARGESAPDAPGEKDTGRGTAPDETGQPVAAPSAHDAPQHTAVSDPAHTTGAERAEASDVDPGRESKSKSAKTGKSKPTGKRNGSQPDDAYGED